MMMMMMMMMMIMMMMMVVVVVVVRGYLTIRPFALKGCGSIAHEAKPNGLLTRGLIVIEGVGSNCFSIAQLVGQKKAIIKLGNAS